MRILTNLLLITIALYVGGVNCANILGVFPFPSPSHHMLGSTLLIALAKRGHNVTMLSPYGLEENVDNYTHINTEELVVKEKEVTDNIIKAKEEDKLHIIVKYIKEITHKTLRHPHVRDLLTNKANRFDAIAIDGLGAETMLALSHHFHAPIVLLSLIGDMPWYGQYTGNFYPLSYVPTVESVDLKTFAGRLRNFVMGFWNLIALGWPYDETIKELIFEYFPDAPPLTQLRKDVALVLLNSHFTYETPRPYAPKSVQIGGFNLVNRKPIPADLLMWLDGAGDGVVLVSYGSKIKGYAFDGEKIEIFLDTFAKLRQKVLWKFDVREVKELTGIERIPGNVRLEKWIPQKEVLDHPNVKLFVTHGGMGGITESIYAGVPMLGTAFYGDQVANVKNMAERGYGIEMAFRNLTRGGFRDGIDEVLTNPKYAEMVKKASMAFKNQPMCPLEKAMFYVEHVVQFNGTEHMQLASMNLTFVQHNLIDIFFFVLTTTFVSIYVTLKILRISLRCVFNRKRAAIK